jgi:hypothetical protein
MYFLVEYQNERKTVKAKAAATVTEVNHLAFGFNELGDAHAKDVRIIGSARREDVAAGNDVPRLACSGDAEVRPVQSRSCALEFDLLLGALQAGVSRFTQGGILMSVMRFQTNIPVALRMRSIEGRPVEGQFGGMQAMFSAEEGAFYVSEVVGSILVEARREGRRAGRDHQRRSQPRQRPQVHPVDGGEIRPGRRAARRHVRRAQGRAK